MNCKQEMEMNPHSIAILDLAPSIIAKLTKAGFRYTSDLNNLSIRELCNESQLEVNEAQTVLSLIQDQNSSATIDIFGQSAWDIYTEALKWKPISLGIPEFDEILGGGFQRGQVTEICGGPGLGKTHLGIHACLTGQYLTRERNSKSKAVYIDTEGSFVIQRVANMAAELAKDYSLQGFTLSRDELLQGLIYYRVFDHVELVELVRSLSSVLESLEVNVVVVDSVAFHFRYGFEDVSHRLRALDSLAVNFHSLAAKYHVAVVLLNHVTTKSSGHSIQAKAATMETPNGNLEVPALGESWSHVVCDRVTLLWENNCRVARMTKSSSQNPLSAHYEVNSKGVRSVSRQD